MIANSLFITGCWKTTWAWIKEAGRKPNGREEKWTTLSVMLDQGQQRRLREQRAFMQTKVVMWIHANYFCQSC